jgi:hypothetical protein
MRPLLVAQRFALAVRMLALAGKFKHLACIVAVVRTELLSVGDGAVASSVSALLFCS